MAKRKPNTQDKVEAVLWAMDAYEEMHGKTDITFAALRELSEELKADHLQELWED